MSFSDNLQVLRKRNNLTQEQLAEQLEVSRQAVSKWESGQSYPEMEKLLIICDMFHCDMDSLVKGDMTLEDQADAAGYDRFMNSFSHRITGCVTLILAAVTLMAFLDGIVHEDILAIFLIAVVGVSVAVMIVTGINMEAFEKKYPHIQDFYSEEERSVFTRRFGIAIAFAVCLILFGICVNIALDSINIPLKDQFSGGFFLLYEVCLVFRQYFRVIYVHAYSFGDCFCGAVAVPSHHNYFADACCLQIFDDLWCFFSQRVFDADDCCKFSFDCHVQM